MVSTNGLTNKPTISMGMKSNISANPMRRRKRGPFIAISFMPPVRCARYPKMPAERMAAYWLTKKVQTAKPAVMEIAPVALKKPGMRPSQFMAKMKMKSEAKNGTYLSPFSAPMFLYAISSRMN